MGAPAPTPVTPPTMAATPPPALTFPPRPPSASPVPYERPLRQWAPAPAPELSNDTGEPVTFQVYTAQDISAGRGLVRTAPSFAPQKKSSLLLRVGMVLLGAIIILFTAAAVIAVSTEDPTTPEPPAPEPPVATTTEPAPSTITIGDPIGVPNDAPATSPSASASAAIPAAAARPKPKAPAPPPSLKGLAPPPNPYGN